MCEMTVTMNDEFHVAGFNEFSKCRAGAASWLVNLWEQPSPQQYITLRSLSELQTPLSKAFLGNKLGADFIVDKASSMDFFDVLPEDDLVAKIFSYLPVSFQALVLADMCKRFRFIIGRSVRHMTSAKDKSLSVKVNRIPILHLHNSFPISFSSGLLEGALLESHQYALSDTKLCGHPRR